MRGRPQIAENYEIELLDARSGDACIPMRESSSIPRSWEGRRATKTRRPPSHTTKFMAVSG